MNFSNFSNFSNTSEKAIEAYLVKRLAALGGLCLKLNTSTATGYPDRLCLLRGGRMFFVELKSKGETPRVIQTVRIGALRRMGYDVFVCDSKEKIDEVLAETISAARD